MRGTAAGEPVVSQAQTDAYDAGYDSIFGRDRKPIRGRWVATPDGLVPADQYVPPEPPSAAGRKSEAEIYGNDVAPDGTDISSRRKRREWMRATGTADADDFKGVWAKAEKARLAERQRMKTGEPTKETREAVARALYKMRKP